MRVLAIGFGVLLLLNCGTLRGEEPFREFVEGLRRRGYYDSALHYLDQVEAQRGLREEIRQVIPYERAETLLQSAKELSTLENQRKQLDAAQAAFEEFVKGAPNHPLAGRANTARGRIFMEKARVEIWDGEKPSNEGSREKYRESARQLIRQARRIFEQARDQHKKSWESFPTYIPEEDKVRRAARDEAESLYMEAQLDIAQCGYWEAQTYDRGTARRKELLTQAALEFEAIHEKYRSMIGGLFARAWQGKCFEEQDEIGIALGIYGELLKHEGMSDSLRNLQDRVLRFRLICLNHEQRRDYQLVINEAEAWLKEAGARARTDIGLGIQWELCRAQEALGMSRTVPDLQRRQYLTLALSRARGINRSPGELKTPSSAMIQRLMLALDREPGDPKDFETADATAGQLWDEVTAQNERVRQLKSEGKIAEAKKQQESLQATAAEMARLYELALKLVRADTDVRLVNLARLRLAYGYLLQGRYFDAAALAEFQMTKFGDEFPEMGREAGFLAMSAFDYAYNEAEEADRDFEARQLTRTAERLAELWPDSDRANDARNAVAKIHWQQGDLLSAAEWWLKIPAGTSMHADAQVRAGKAYWRQYVLQVGKPAEERPSGEELNRWKDLAVKHLEAGLNEAEQSVPDDSPLPDELVGAKLTLASIRNLDGVYQTQGDVTGALELLTKPPHPVVEAVAVAKGQTRPTEPTKATSREMASAAYQQLLRTYIGLRNLDEARKARQQLEQVAGGDDSAALTQVFVRFGRELQQELERLQAAGETERLAEVRAGFEGFLNDLAGRKDGQTFNSLLWIAETYASLGDGSADDPQQARQYFDKAAATYRSILERSGKDEAFQLTSQQTLACKLRLVNTLRRQKDFPAAETVMLEILQQSPNAPDAQFEAAQLYQDWAANGAADAAAKYELALNGNADEKQAAAPVWGWAMAAQRLQQALYGREDARLASLHFDARYNLAECERRLAGVLNDEAAAEEHLRRASASIIGFQRLSKRWPDDQYERFNELYRSIQQQLGNPVADLPRELLDTEQPLARSNGSETKVAAAPEEPLPAEPAAQGNWLLMFGVLVLGGTAVGGLFFLTVSQNKKRRMALAPLSSAASAATSSGEGLPSPGPIDSADQKIDFSFIAQSVDAAAPKREGVKKRPAGGSDARRAARPASSSDAAAKRPPTAPQSRTGSSDKSRPPKGTAAARPAGEQRTTPPNSGKAPRKPRPKNPPDQAE